MRKRFGFEARCANASFPSGEAPELDGRLLATSLAVLVMAGVAMAVLTALGIIPPDAPYLSMLIWCALFGFGGSILSLALSKTIAKRSKPCLGTRYRTSPTATW